MTQEKLLELSNNEIKRLANLVNQDVQNVLNLYMIAFKLENINNKVNGPKPLDEALVTLQIDAFSTAKMALNFANLEPISRIILKSFIDLRMKGMF